MTISRDNKLKIEYLNDPVEDWLGRTSSEDNVFELLSVSVHNWERSVQGEIVIPTSGGYDSRLLNFIVEDKARIIIFYPPTYPKKARCLKWLFLNFVDST